MAIKIPVSISPHKLANKRIGHYLQVKGLFPLGTPDLDKQQFLGVHKWMCATIHRPGGVVDLLGLSADLPRIRGCGEVMWMGGVRCYKTPRGLRMYMPFGVWRPQSPAFDEIVYTSGLVDEVYGKSGRRYYVLSLPLLTREVILNRESPDVDTSEPQTDLPNADESAGR